MSNFFSQFLLAKTGVLSGPVERDAHKISEQVTREALARKQGLTDPTPPRP